MVAGGFRVEVVPSLRKNQSCFGSWLADMGVSVKVVGGWL